MAARRPADPAALTEQWRSLDTMLDKLATRTRSYAAAGNADDDDGPQPAVAGTASALSQLAAMQRERDQLRRLLAAANNDLRAARAELRELRARAGARAGGGRAAARGRVRNPLATWWLRWWERGR